MNLRLPRIAGGVASERRLTGRAVLLMLVGFFALVIAVNLFMVRAAITTFGGVDTPSSYEAGLNFKADEAAAAAQNALGWKVDAEIVPKGGGETVALVVRDASGQPVTDTSATVSLTHPIDERRDVAVAMEKTGPGSFRGASAAEPGQWYLEIAIAKGGQRLFFSRNRVIVR